MHNYTLLETKLSALLDSLKEVFTPSEISEVRQFLEAGEYGLALETTCGIIAEEQKQVGNQVLEQIRELSDLMRLDSEIVSAVISTAGKQGRKEAGRDREKGSYYPGMEVAH
jgi:hypothetical protein